jgi:predicted nucleic acid-binding protein
MSVHVVLDAAAFDCLQSAGGGRTRALLRRAAERKHEVVCAAVTLAEICRGAGRTRSVETALARRHGGQRLRVIPTDERLAKLVGAILHDTKSDSTRIADAHVIAVAAGADSALVITSDPGDIMALAAAVPGTRITTRPAE